MFLSSTRMETYAFWARKVNGLHGTERHDTAVRSSQARPGQDREEAGTGAGAEVRAGTEAGAGRWQRQGNGRAGQGSRFLEFWKFRGWLDSRE